MIPKICDDTHNRGEKARKNILFQHLVQTPHRTVRGMAEKSSVPIQEKKIWFLNKHIPSNTQPFYARTIKPEH
jgi:hypothetical protein